MSQESRDRGREENGRGKRSHQAEMLSEAMPSARVTRDGTQSGEFVFALGAGLLHPLPTGTPRVETLPEEEIAHWHERPPEERDPSSV